MQPPSRQTEESLTTDPSTTEPEPQPVFIIDWDGVCQTAVWPEWGDWLPGAVDSLKELTTHGQVRIFSSRLNPYKYGEDGVELRSEKEVNQDVSDMRMLLNLAGLEDVVIHATPGKPSGSFYLDDRAVEFDGNWPKAVERMTTPRNPGSERFHNLLKEAGLLHDKKQQDYGREHDPFANVRAATDWGMSSWVGACLRMSDKMRRLQAFARSGDLQNESALDSLMDIAVYALIAYVLMEEEVQA